MALDPWEIMVRMVAEGPTLKDVVELCTEVDTLRIEACELRDFIRSEGASATFTRWRATRGQRPLSRGEGILESHRARLREPMAVPKPQPDTEEKP